MSNASSPARYTIDGADECSIQEFLDANADDPISPEDIDALAALGVGDEMALGGGDAATFTMRRVS